jgi:hypothetical protein
MPGLDYRSSLVRNPGRGKCESCKHIRFYHRGHGNTRRILMLCEKSPLVTWKVILDRCSKNGYFTPEGKHGRR